MIRSPGNAEWWARRWLKNSTADERAVMRQLLDSDEFIEGKEVDQGARTAGATAGNPN